MKYIAKVLFFSGKLNLDNEEDYKPGTYTSYLVLGSLAFRNISKFGLLHGPGMPPKMWHFATSVTTLWSDYFTANLTLYIQ